ncbi:HAD-IA family hydrolase [Gaoshiqia sp. Z1-71]|uniref:HAD-IA family hydrolase n=1 Tax=Gaoshiqia hydrogeniformans TaxID=3290090 RepID=UPI003BF7E305
MTLDKHPDAEALIFDLDGTLSDSLPVHIATWYKVCAHYNCRFDEKMVNELTGMPTIRFAERIIADNRLEGVNPEEMVRMKQEIFWSCADLLKPHPPVVDLVYKYHGKIPLAVGTGASRRSAMVQLEKLNLTRYFDAIVTADDVSSHKPEPETFLKCAGLIGVAPQNCQVLEDGVLGMQAAKTAGMYLTDVRPFTYGN